MRITQQQGNLTDTHKSLILAETRVHRLQLPLFICYHFQVLMAYWSYYGFLTDVPLFNALTGGNPLEIPAHPLYYLKLESTGYICSASFVALSVTSSTY